MKKPLPGRRARRGKMPVDDRMTPRVFTRSEFGQLFQLSKSMVARIISHGLVRLVYFGERSFVPLEEVDRLARDGVPEMPRGYRRMTTGPVYGATGRPPRKQKKARRVRPGLST